MYKLLRKLNDTTYEDFKTFSTIEECEIAAKVISEFLNYNIEDFVIGEVED